MMVSSAMLHVQRISYLAKVSLSTLLFIKYILLSTWIIGRLIVSPHVMYYAFVHLPLTLLHAALLIAGIGLFVMNCIWGFKIAKRKNLAF